MHFGSSSLNTRNDSAKVLLTQCLKSVKLGLRQRNKRNTETQQQGSIMQNQTYFMHYRRRNRAGDVLPQGGATLAIRPVGEDRIVVGMALCSQRDVFNKKLGRTIAEGRLSTAEAGFSNAHVFTIAMDELDRPIKEVVNEAFAVTMEELGLE